VLEESYKHATQADLCLAMGSSLTVTPAADIPKIIGKKGIADGGLVIVNLQETPLDKLASLRIFAKCEDVSRLLMEKMGLSIPEFRLQRKLLIAQKAISGSPKYQICVQGMSSDGLPFSYVNKVDFKSSALKDTSVSSEPFQVIIHKFSIKLTVKLTVYFFGHYGEPPLEFEWTTQSSKNASKLYSLEFNPFTQKWADPVIDNDTAVADVTAKLEAAAL
jgi:mono-ADP-ribosyltransferase sirtuin 6